MNTQKNTELIGKWFDGIWSESYKPKIMRRLLAISIILIISYPSIARVQIQSETNKKQKQIAVIFEVVPDASGREKYLEIASKLKEELKQIDGFISIERFKSLSGDGKILSLSFWENEQAVNKWRTQMEHRKGQKAGHSELFKHYRIRVAAVMRDYTNKDRKQAPADSNKHLYN